MYLKLKRTLPINSVNISTISQATNLILIGHRAMKKTYVMVQKGQKSQKVDIEPDNSQPTTCRFVMYLKLMRTLVELMAATMRTFNAKWEMEFYIVETMKIETTKTDLLDVECWRWNSLSCERI